MVTVSVYPHSSPPHGCLVLWLLSACSQRGTPCSPQASVDEGALSFLSGTLLSRTPLSPLGAPSPWQASCGSNTTVIFSHPFTLWGLCTFPFHWSGRKGLSWIPFIPVFPLTGSFLSLCCQSMKPDVRSGPCIYLLSGYTWVSLCQPKWRIHCLLSMRDCG